MTGIKEYVILDGMEKELFVEDKELLHTLMIHSTDRLLHRAATGMNDSVKSLGYVLELIRKDNNAKETYVIEFNETGGYRVRIVENDKYPDGAILYYYDDTAEAIVKSTIVGQEFIDEEEL